MRQWHFCNTNATGQNDVVPITMHGALLLAKPGGKHVIWNEIQKNGSNTHGSSFFTKKFQKMQKYHEQRNFIKINKCIINGTVFPQGTWIRNSFNLIPNTATGSSETSYDIKHSSRDYSLHSQPIHKPNISR
jgi:hypothetical protein